MSKQLQEGLPAGVSRYEVRDQLSRILLSRHFLKAKKKSRFLEFLCEQALSGMAEGVNEYAIGVDIYGRGADFNPQQDSIVRVQAHEIRKSLVAYYTEEGRHDRLRVNLPAGGYVPVFTRIDDVSPEAPQEVDAAEDLALPRRPRYWLVALIAICSALPAGWLLRGVLQRSPNAAVVRLADSAIWFWQPFLPPAQPPLVVLPVHPLLRAAHGGDTAATLTKGQEIDKKKLPEFRDTIHFRELPVFRFVPNTTDFTAIGESLGLLDLSELLRGGGQRIQVTSGRLVDYEAVKRGNTILLGGNQAWSGRIFVYPAGFEFHNGVISNKQPLPGEQASYRPEFDPVTNDLRRDYALVLMLPNVQRERRVLLIYGIYTQGSQAAIEYVTNPDRLAELRKALIESSPDRKTIPKYFQVLLSTTVENYVPGQTSLVSTRAIPE